MKKRKAVHDEFQEGWDSAVRLYCHLSEHGVLAEAAHPPVHLEPDESCYADAELTYARGHGPRARAPTARDAFERPSRQNHQPTDPWWDRQPVHVVLTDRRILCDVAGEWLSIWYREIADMTVDLASWSFELTLRSGDRMRLHGPMAPAYALAVAHRRRGQDSLRDPAFAPLAQHSPIPPA